MLPKTSRTGGAIIFKRSINATRLRIFQFIYSNLHANKGHANKQRRRSLSVSPNVPYVRIRPLIAATHNAGWKCQALQPIPRLQLVVPSTVALRALPQVHCVSETSTLDKSRHYLLHDGNKVWTDSTAIRARTIKVATETDVTVVECQGYSFARWVGRHAINGNKLLGIIRHCT